VERHGCIKVTVVGRSMQVLRTHTPPTFRSLVWATYAIAEAQKRRVESWVTVRWRSQAGGGRGGGGGGRSLDCVLFE